MKKENVTVSDQAVNKLLSDGSQKILAIEKKIAELAADKALSADLTPEGGAQPRQTGYRQLMTNEYRKMQDAIKQQTAGDVAKIISAAPEEKKIELSERVDEWQKPGANHYGYIEASVEKDFDQAQEVFAAMQDKFDDSLRMDLSRKQADFIDLIKEARHKEIASEKVKMSMADQFDMSLSYQPSFPVENNELDKKQEPIMSMSASYEMSLIPISTGDDPAPAMTMERDETPDIEPDDV